MGKEIIRTLTIAGLDASGGAGLIADISTFEEFGTYGQAVLTTVVTMDPENWNHQVKGLPLDLLKQQIETILTSDVPIKAMKTGMLGSKEIVELARETIERAKIEKTVIDPVLVCKGTDEVLNPDTAVALRELLMPIAYVATPNIFEAGQMADLPTPKTLAEIEAAAKAIHDRGVQYVVVKGSRHLDPESALDLFYDGKSFEWLAKPKLENPATHGAGCTFAAAITAGLANDLEPLEAVKKAKDYVYIAIKNGFAYNKFVSPVYRPAYKEYR
ncbi:MAG: bifunctional hydroxymethylpyrimidine kinase/phosphomethylpyrimidine kinase [Eubacteriales bacterium]|nr:bifunctional hydroxymethylpyrimidine kinase/phosphomethylpyrimidine kinase [Eubacteriales bacterium]